jgi:hypothetical protein
MRPLALRRTPRFLRGFPKINVPTNQTVFFGSNHRKSGLRLPAGNHESSATTGTTVTTRTSGSRPCSFGADFWPRREIKDDQSLQKEPSAESILRHVPRVTKMSVRVNRLMATFVMSSFLWMSQADGHGIVIPGAGPVNRSMCGASVAAPIDAAGAMLWNPAAITGL